MWTIPMLRMVILFVPASPMSIFNFFDLVTLTDSAPDIASRQVAVRTSPALDAGVIAPVSNAQAATTERDPISTATRSATSQPTQELEALVTRLRRSAGLLVLMWAIGCGVALNSLWIISFA
jgi:hypothetical protein